MAMEEADGGMPSPKAVTTGHEPPDAELIRRAGQGDEDAFHQLFERHAPALRRRIQRLLPSNVGRKVSASDILQEARIVAFRRCGQFVVREDGSVRQWLDRIASLKLKEAVKRYVKAAKRDVRREVTRGDRPDTDYLEGRRPSPSQAAIANETRSHVRLALEALPDDYRTVLRLAREERLRLREVAERMGRSREAVKKLYARALSRFAEILEQTQGGSHA